MKATAKANTNIALIKYWGKRDEALFLPMNSSISITLDQFFTTTTVQFCDCLSADVFLLNQHLADERETKRISQFLDLIRKKAGTTLHAVVSSTNHVPIAAGLASSASGFAALAAAATKALDLPLTNQELSKLARQGSGSASRSIFGGFVEWQKGEQRDGEDSFSTPILNEKDWDISILSVLVDSEKKKVLSREGMKRTVETSPFYQGWLDTIEQDLRMTKEAITRRDFDQLGEVAEANALKMHATTLGANPPFMYWSSGTLDVIQKVQEMRSLGVSVYFTIDAGPNVKVLCLPKDEQRVSQELSTIPSVRDLYICHPGSGVTYLPEHQQNPLLQ